MRVNINRAHLEYRDHQLPDFEIEKIERDAEKFARERFEDFKKFAAEFFASEEDFDDFFSDVIDDNWAEFDYEEFEFQTIHEAYPENENKPLPEPFATDLHHYAKNCFAVELEKMLLALKPRFESNAVVDTFPPRAEDDAVSK